MDSNQRPIIVKFFKHLGAILFYLVLFLAVPDAAFAIEKKKRFSSPEDGVLRICTQNLERYGEHLDRASRERYEAQRDALAVRIMNARCDIVAVQEVAGETKEEALLHLRDLAITLSRMTQWHFSAFVGESFDKYIRNGFLVAASAGVVKETKDFLTERVPKLNPLGPNVHFIRSPLGLLLSVNGAVIGGCQGKPIRNIFLIVMHFKSKSDSWKDPTRTDFEASRMETAEALRTIALREQKRLGDETAVLVLGDRNSPPQSASARILAGELTLEDFSRERKCRLSEELEPDCPPQVAFRQPDFTGLFVKGHPLRRHPVRSGASRVGTYRYKNQQEIIDEILVRNVDLPLFMRDNRQPAVGLTGTFNKGSDHKLLWAEVQDFCR